MCGEEPRPEPLCPFWGKLRILSVFSPIRTPVAPPLISYEHLWKEGREPCGRFGEEPFFRKGPSPISVLPHRFLNLLTQLFDSGDEGNVLNNAVDEERGEVRQADLAHKREVLGEHDGPFDDFDLVPINLGGVVGGCDHVAAGGAYLNFIYI